MGDEGAILFGIYHLLKGIWVLTITFVVLRTVWKFGNYLNFLTMFRKDSKEK